MTWYGRITRIEESNAEDAENARMAQRDKFLRELSGYSAPSALNSFFYRHSRESGNPFVRPRGGLKWIPAFAGMTAKISCAIAQPIESAKAGIVCCLLLALAGCSSPENKYFTLSATDATQPTGQAASGRTIAIDDVTIPAYLDRPQIVIKQDPNRADIREYERWVEPLDGMVRRVLAADLAARLGPARVLDKPGKDSALLSVTIEEFGPEGDHAVLRGQWTLKPAGKDAPAGVSHSFSKDEPLGKAETPDMVAAMSRLVGALGDEMAGSVEH